MDYSALAKLQDELHNFSNSHHTSNGNRSESATVKELDDAVNSLARLVEKLLIAIVQ